MSKTFARFAARAASLTGHYRTFLLALAIILVWAATGPFFGFSNTWQLVINTGTTIVTFLMVFLIQNTQNRDAIAMHLKLDELIRATADADDEMIDAEEDTDAQLAELKRKYAQLHDEHQALREQIAATAS
jgi:low affinity Fe/Cu permease